ncbi:hypothetical protein OSTOST_04189, partial [Ostertagia ostertagi]
METFCYLEYISNSCNIADFINMWLSIIDSMEICDRSIIFAAALLPRCGVSTLDKCFRIVQGLIERCPEAVNTFLMFYSMLYSKSYFEVDRRTVLNAIRGLFINRFAVTPAVNFLSLVCRQPGKERSVAYDLLCDLVAKFPTAFDVVKPLAHPAESDSPDLLEDKLKLMAALCISTYANDLVPLKLCSGIPAYKSCMSFFISQHFSDRSDELLPSLSVLLKKDATVVKAAISVVLALCKEEILDVSTIRKQLGSRVRQTGFEVALSSYCDILATSAALSGEDEEVW